MRFCLPSLSLCPSPLLIVSVLLLQCSDTLKSLHFRLIFKKVLKQPLLLGVDGLGLGVSVLQQRLVLLVLVLVLPVLGVGGGCCAGAGDKDGGEQEEAELGGPHHAVQCPRVLGAEAGLPPRSSGPCLYTPASPPPEPAIEAEA